MGQAAVAVAAVLWALSLPLAAYGASGRLAGSRGYPLAAAVYSIGAVVCHQNPDRSFTLWAAQMPVCARCTGIYFGAALAGLFVAGTRVAGRTRSVGSHALRMALVIALLVNGLTLAFEWVAGRAPGHAVRALAGALLGASATSLVMTAFPTRRSSETAHDDRSGHEVD
jgi:uncharacterized membrane protein